MRLGIDIGGTTINLGLVKDGQIVSLVSAPSFGVDASLGYSISHLFNLIDKQMSKDVQAIGVGVPSVVDAENGIVYDASNIPSWKEVHLKELLEARYNVPVSINNDANCFALGAAETFGCKEGEILVGVTLGTGVGVGVVADGKIVNGLHTGVGELFWLPYKNNTIEYWCSKQRFLSNGLEPVELCAKADAGDAVAIALFNDFGKDLGRLLAVVMSAYDPDRIVLGGGLANNHRHFAQAMVDELAKVYPYPESVKDLQISYLPQTEAAIKGASVI